MMLHAAVLVSGVGLFGPVFAAIATSDRAGCHLQKASGADCASSSDELTSRI
jgi:hypothetical protein